MLAVTIAIATIIPFLVLYGIYRLNLYAAGSYRFVVVCFVWGCLMLVLASTVGNQLVTTLQWVDALTFTRYVAPVTEELLKAAILIYLMRRPEFTYFVDGAIYGFAVGMGFAIVENALYLSASPEISTAIGRVLSTNLMHATATAVVGITLGRARFHRFSGRLLWAVVGLLVAISFHVGFNNLVTRVSGNLLLVYAAICGISGVAFIVIMIKRGIGEQKKWIEETLGAADRVTKGEVAVVQQLDNVFEILAPLARQFGPDKAQKIEDFLTLQARLGILRKSAEKIPNEAMRKGVEQQMAKLRAEIDTARREVGPYCMVYLRNIFPEQTSPLWQTLEHRLSTRPQSSSTANNIWSTLKQRTQQPNAKE